MTHRRSVGQAIKLSRARAALKAILNPTRSMTYKQRVSYYRAMAMVGLEFSK